MIPFFAPLIAAGACPSLKDTSIGGLGSGTLTAGISYATDGSTSSTFTGSAAVPGLWYTPVGGSPGNSYYISFHKTSGTAWDAGLVDGTVYALSSPRALTWTTGSGLAAVVTVSLWLDAGGTISAGTATLDVSIN